MHDKDEWPEESELVVCTVEDVKDFVAFVRLDEYASKKGLIHISEIATGWVKYIRDFVREGQKVVCKVLSVDPKRGHIDLSLKDVNDHQRREKIQEWKNEQKAEKWIGFVAKDTGADPQMIRDAFYSNFGLLYSAFEEIVTKGDAALKKLDFEKGVNEALKAVAQENVKIPKVTITGTLVLTSTKPDGVNIIRRALRSAQPKVEEDVEIELVYLGAPNYRIKVTAPDYKRAEKAIEKASSAAIGVMERAGDAGKFVRKAKSA
ncbi:translation initiation factor IF-2 subunit alpha [Methanofollis formosanus]|uniref:Translation initiation factor 2 subunit alpha n=1 Tax=Methanofollis formosanus TaxID=299308 RepID=A0A8G1EG51_9EURY|nr:translation initiation factor IF-2 subunit alpha [Methanofollis formosanus]QYZ78796.1 translation initiation factor IF-2 subunit alpha [Methanofollis formosanus]